MIVKTVAGTPTASAMVSEVLSFPFPPPVLELGEVVEAELSAEVEDASEACVVGNVSRDDFVVVGVEGVVEISGLEGVVVIVEAPLPWPAAKKAANETVKAVPVASQLEIITE
jgi:hypothetical protein